MTRKMICLNFEMIRKGRGGEGRTQEREEEEGVMILSAF